MTVRSVLNKFNRCFLVCGIGSINYNQGNFKTTVWFYVLRYFIICISFVVIYDVNKWVIGIFNFIEIILEIQLNII